jgi:translation initiation factor IF-2
MAEPIAQPKTITIPAVLTVGEFADAIDMPVTKVIGELMKNGVMATINEQIDFDTAAIIGGDLGVEIEAEAAVDDTPVRPVKLKLADGEGELRPPIVAVMGHVDHGKTSLLDAIRSASVADGEAGGITQHIGAYQIKKNDRWITFLDTPGHEAFSALRAHGARMTDVAVIVVAADDGVRPQTKEAIKHAQDAGVQLVVAINKIDKEGADPMRVRTELNELGLVPEEWGGETVMMDVSARSGEGIDKLLDTVLLVADIEDLRALPTGPANGVVVESHLDTGQGPVATVLISNGLLKVGDYLVSGGTYAKVRSLTDWTGKRIKQASPGMPALITGFKAVPAFGDVFNAAASERIARDTSASATRNEKVQSLRQVKRIDATALGEAISAAGIRELNVVVKADVQGSLESLLEAISSLRNSEVAVKVVSSAVGDISESDILFAKTADAALIGFNVGSTSGVRHTAAREFVQLRMYKVIYELLDDLRAALSDMLPPEIIENVVGELEILGVFKVTKAAVVCGGKITSGRLEPKATLRIKRKKEIIGAGVLTSLQRDKQEVREAFEGETCGLNISTPATIELGDMLEFYTTESKARTL